MPGVIGQHKMDYMLLSTGCSVLGFLFVCLFVCLGVLSHLLSLFLFVFFFFERVHEVGGVGRWAGHERS